MCGSFAARYGYEREAAFPVFRGFRYVGRDSRVAFGMKTRHGSRGGREPPFVNRALSCFKGSVGQGIVRTSEEPRSPSVLFRDRGDGGGIFRSFPGPRQRRVWASRSVATGCRSLPFFLHADIVCGVQRRRGGDGRPPCCRVLRGPDGPPSAAFETRCPPGGSVSGPDRSVRPDSRGCRVPSSAGDRRRCGRPSRCRSCRRCAWR